MSVLEVLSVASVVIGLFFFIAGTAGLIRFPDHYSRLHALTKADTLGLGFIALGAAFHIGDGWSAAKLLAVWLLALFAAATIAQLIARASVERWPDVEAEEDR